MRIAVVGTGYVGLVTGTCFAEAGNTVTCVDIDPAKIERLKAGEMPIYEPGLEAMVQRNIAAERLLFTTDLSEGIKDALVIFLALPTPPGKDGAADLSYVLGVGEDLGKILQQYAVIVDKSTVPVGTAAQVTAQINKNASVPFDVVSNPEFLREGHALEDFQNPDRIVIGSSSEKATEIMQTLYREFTDEPEKIILMDEASAELCKYAANAFLATKISFMNDIANLCEIVGADVQLIKRGIGSDNRIGRQFLNAGIGYGGSCFPKDVQALRRAAEENGSSLRILDAVTDVNEDQKHVLSKKVTSYFAEGIDGKTFALWGLAFKPDTDDIREAPALSIIEDLTAAGATIVAYDPEASENVQRTVKNDKLSYATDKYQALEGADALIIATEWQEFKVADFDKIRSLLTAPVIFDGRNLFEDSAVEGQGFYYNSIGRSTISQKEA